MMVVDSVTCTENVMLGVKIFDAVMQKWLVVAEPRLGRAADHQ